MATKVVYVVHWKPFFGHDDLVLTKFFGTEALATNFMSTLTQNACIWFGVATVPSNVCWMTTESLEGA